jgi:dienelactone hydrolase
MSRFMICLTLGFLTSLAMAQSFPAVSDLPRCTELPDPLRFFNGSPVRTPEEWQRRRVELKKLFEHYMYGALPRVAGTIRAEVTHEDKEAFGGSAVLREVAVTPAEGCPPLYLLLVLPKKTQGPVPVFLGMNFSGNHSLVDDPKVRIPASWIYPGPGVENDRATEKSRGSRKDVWAIDQTVRRGYAVATFYNGDVDPDEKEHRNGMRPFLKSQGYSPGTIMAWAWGLIRAVDYLLSVPEIDAQRIAIVGHSRLGKTALVAAAFDERIALIIPHQSGTGGAAPSRSKNPKAETVARINTAFPHWFNDRFKEFNEQVDRLPFDQHALIALLAPRPVLLTNAEEDQWANPDGQFEMLRAANPVYRLLGVDGLGPEDRPMQNRIVGNKLAYFLRPGPHSMTRDDWLVFLEFADRHWLSRR